MKKSQTFSVRLSGEEVEKLEQAAAQFGVDKSDIFRTALSEFGARLSVENVITDSIEVLEKRLARMEKKQEDFTRVIGNTIALKDSEKPTDLRQRFADRITQISNVIGAE